MSGIFLTTGDIAVNKTGLSAYSCILVGAKQILNKCKHSMLDVDKCHGEKGEKRTMGERLF